MPRRALLVLALLAGLTACSTPAATPASSSTPSSASAPGSTSAPATTVIQDSNLCDRIPELKDEVKRAVLENDPEYPPEAVTRLGNSISSCYLRVRTDTAIAEIAIVRYATPEIAAAARDSLAKDWRMQIENAPATPSDGLPSLSDVDAGTLKAYGASRTYALQIGTYFVLAYSPDGALVDSVLEKLAPYIGTV